MKHLYWLPAIGLVGCAAFSNTPSASELAHLPVLEYQALPDAKQAPDAKFILHLPAGSSLPLNFKVSSTLLESTVEGALPRTATLRKSLYLYRGWASYDRQHWQPLEQLFRGELGVSVGKTGAEIAVKLDERTH